MDPTELRLSLDEDIAETHKLLTVATRPIVRECLVQLFTTLEQSKARLLYGAALHQSNGGGQAFSSGYAAGFSHASNGIGAIQAVEAQQTQGMTGQLPDDGVLSPYDPVWSAPNPTHYRSSSAGPSWLSTQMQSGLLALPNAQQLSIQELCPGSHLHNTLTQNGSAALPVLPALRYGMNLQFPNPQAVIPPEAPFRILTTCSWEQNPYTVKVYVPLHGVKTELLRAVFERNSLEIKAVNLQGRNYRFTVKQTFMPINPDGCAVVASKTKKNILITIAKASSKATDEQSWHDLQRGDSG